MSKPSLPIPRPLTLTRAAALAFVALLGCKNQDGPGDLSVDFVLGNNKSCAEVGVENVIVTLSRSDEVLYMQTGRCEDGPVLLEDVTPNNYDVLVEGLDSSLYVVFDNLDMPAGERKVEVFEDSLKEFSVDMLARPADLMVRWDFEFSSCSQSGIDRFEVRAFEAGGATLMLEGEIDCEVEPDPDVAGGYHLFPDPDRVLVGTQLGEVGVVPVDASGTMVGEPVTFTFDPVGAGYPVRLTLSCTGTGCTGTGMLDED